MYKLWIIIAFYLAMGAGFGWNLWREIKEARDYGNE